MPLRDAHNLPIAAVILTGGSSGIGKSIITHIGRVDPSVLICNLSRVEPTGFEAELNLRHTTCDLSNNRSREAAIEQIMRVLVEAKPEGRILLINNAGFGAYGRAIDLSRAQQRAIVEVNVTAVVDLTAAFLPEIKQRGGAIINVASTAAFQPTPFMAAYGAAKSFVLNWGMALREELRGSSVHVLTVCPGPTVTAFFERAGMAKGAIPGGFVESSEVVVQTMFRALERGRGVVVSGWPNKITTALASTIPLTWVAWISGRILARLRLKPSQPA